MLIAILGIHGQSVIRCIAKHSWWFVPKGLYREEDSNPEFDGGNPGGTQDKKRVRPSMKTIENFLQIRALEISML